jgi:hypothetical protein
MNCSNCSESCRSQSAHPSCDFQSQVSINASELFALPCLVLILVLILQGSRQISFAILSHVYSRYRMHRIAVRYRRIERLEYLFRLNSSSQERG